MVRFTRNLLHFCVIFMFLFTKIVESSIAHKKGREYLPSFVKICRRNDQQLNQCARSSFNALKNRINVGIPELFIPPIEPLVIPEMKLDQDSGAIYLHSTYKDIEIHGLSNFTLNDLIIDPIKLKFSMSMSFPRISMNALYSMKGKIMMMPLMGEGDFKANFTDVELNTLILGQRFRKHGHDYIHVTDVKVKYNLGKAKLYLENLFNGDKALGERMNVFLNENWESLSDEISPLMEKAMEDIIRASTDNLFETYSYDDLLPE